jgi:hypothetical protein
MTTPQFCSRAILILGMHRSGTSAITRVLNLLGVELGTRLMPAAAGNNEGGFWEHLGVVEIHEALLQALGRSWYDLRPLPDGWMRSDAAQAAKVKLAAVIESDFADTPLWAVKDPRLCRLLPLWHELLADLRIEPSAVMVLRHPNEVARSLRDRDGFPLEQGRLTWLEHVADAERDSRGWRRSIVAYDDVLSGWRPALEHVRAALAVDWPNLPSSVAVEVDAFLDRGKRHHDVDAAQANELPGLIQDVYVAMRAAARGEDSQSELGAAVDRYHEMADIFAGGFKAEIENSHARTAGLVAAMKSDAHERSEAMLLTLQEIDAQVGAPIVGAEKQLYGDNATLYWCDNETGTFDEAFKITLECSRPAESERLIFRLPALPKVSWLRIDPSTHPGRFDLLGLCIDRTPVEDFADRVESVSQLRLEGGGAEHVAIIAMSDDPHVVVNVANLSLDWSRGVDVEIHVLRQKLPKADLGEIWRRVRTSVMDACTRTVGDPEQLLAKERAARLEIMNRLDELFRGADTRHVERHEMLGRDVGCLLRRVDGQTAELAELHKALKAMKDERRRTVLQRIQRVFRQH